MHIIVKITTDNTPTKKSIPVYVELKDTIEILRFRIQNVAESNIFIREIFLDDLKLEEMMTLADYGINEMSTLNVKGYIRVNKVVFVKTIPGKKITIDIKLTETIEILKQRIQDKEGIPPAQQVIIFEGKKLRDYQDLAFYKIKFEDTVFLVLKIPGYMKIFWSSPSGIIYTLDAYSSDSIENIKASIQDISNMHPDFHQIVYDDEILLEERTLADYMIKEHSTLYSLKFRH